jgi:hypothetical protein
MLLRWWFVGEGDAMETRLGGGFLGVGYFLGGGVEDRGLLTSNIYIHIALFNLVLIVAPDLRAYNILLLRFCEHFRFKACDRSTVLSMAALGAQYHTQWLNLTTTQVATLVALR